MMFGFSGGKSSQTIARKKGYMADAQNEWPFLTKFDLSTIKSEAQLVTILKERDSLSREAAETAVHSWTVGKDFSHAAVLKRI